MQKIILIIFLFVITNLFSQEIIGKWKTIDDTTKKAKSIVEIYKENNKYYGKINTILNKKNIPNCSSCKGKYHNKNLTNLIILKDLVKNNNLYENGTITDPKNGKTYSCYLELDGNKKLKIRGFIGFSLLGRTQYWHRLTNEEATRLTNNID